MNIYERTLNTWGQELQVNMAIEEMAECTVALCNQRRGRGSALETASEIADVIIMMHQMRELVGPALVDQQVEYKLNRLSNRLDGVEAIQHG